MVVNNIQFTKIEIKIAKYLFKHYKDRFNVRQLAKKLGINHAHANKLCNTLTFKNILNREELGNSFFFSYNYENNLALKFMEYLLSLEEKEFPPWLIVLLHILKKFEEKIELGLVFGSSIKNKEFNDVDILLIYDAKQSKEIKKIKEEIRKSDLIRQPLRYVEITKKDIILNKENQIFYNILSDNLIFYNAEKYVEVIKKCHK